MEKKASINKPLMIIAAVLSGVGGLSCTIISEWGRYSYDSIIPGLSIFIFTIITVLITVGKLSTKWFMLPFAIYFLPAIVNDIIVSDIINNIQDFHYFFLVGIPIILYVAIFSILTLTILEIINSKIPIILIIGTYFLYAVYPLTAYSRLPLKFIGQLLYFVSILLVALALPNSPKTRSGNKQKSDLLEEQNLALCIVLSIVTCGIYGLVWKYQLCRKIRLLNDESTDCVGEYLCLILVPFYHLYWYYTRGQNLYQGMKKVGAPASDNSVVNLVLALFGFSIVSDALIQNDLNNAAGVLQVRSRTVSVEAENSVSSDEEDAAQTEEPSEDKAEPADENMALLQQLAELHDKGILSDEEFETKKKDLLDRI